MKNYMRNYLAYFGNNIVPLLHGARTSSPAVTDIELEKSPETKKELAKTYAAADIASMAGAVGAAPAGTLTKIAMAPVIGEATAAYPLHVTAYNASDKYKRVVNSATEKYPNLNKVLTAMDFSVLKDKKNWLDPMNLNK